jgi:hypothetical protein
MDTGGCQYDGFWLERTRQVFQVLLIFLLLDPWWSLNIDRVNQRNK